MTIDNVLKNPVVTSVQAVKSGEDIVAVSSSNPLPVTDSALLAKFSATAKSDADRLPISQLDGAPVSGAATSAAVLFTTSLIGYEGLTLQVISAGTSCAISYETSEDQVSWIATGVAASSNTGQSNVLAAMTGTSSTNIQQLVCPRRGSYFRARVSTYGSGTVSIQGVLCKFNMPLVVDARLTGYGGEGVIVSGVSPTIALEARTATKTLVANGQSVRKIGTVDGRQIVRLNSIPELEWQYAAASGGITNTTDVVLQATAGSGIKNYLTGLSIANANATATEVVIKDGASTIIWRMYLAANAPIQSIKFVTPLQSSANAALNVACITTGSQTYINAQGYKAP